MLQYLCFNLKHKEDSTLSYYEKMQYDLRLWLAYRYLYQNPHLLRNERLYKFFLDLDSYFTKKYECETEEMTRKGIKKLFTYESEQRMIINQETVEEMMKEYEIKPYLFK